MALSTCLGLNRSEILGHSARIALAEAECRHIRMNAAKPILQPLAEVGVIELVFAKLPERRRVAMRTLPGPANGVTTTAEFFEQRSRVLLLSVQRVGCRAGRQDNRESHKDSLHLRSVSTAVPGASAASEQSCAMAQPKIQRADQMPGELDFQARFFAQNGLAILSRRRIPEMTAAW